MSSQSISLGSANAAEPQPNTAARRIARQEPSREGSVIGVNARDVAGSSAKAAPSSGEMQKHAIDILA
jgi:hypothetical protein